jgi:hypothetical protein
MFSFPHWTTQSSCRTIIDDFQRIPGNFAGQLAQILRAEAP